MNLAATLARIVRRFPGERIAERIAARCPEPVPARPRAPRVLAWFFLGAIAIHACAFLAMDVLRVGWRDPEYRRRVTRLKERLEENPGRPLVLAIGSSRVSMGVKPSAWEESRPNQPGAADPLLFNMSLVGSGPLMELMCLRRIYADGFKPDAVCFEYWPPFLREDGPYFEPDRIDHARLGAVDRPLVREYFRDPDAVEHNMLWDRINPIYRTRHRLMAQINPKWQPWNKRMEMAWGGLRPWGWLSGLETKYPPDPEKRSVRVRHCEGIYRSQFQGFSIHPMADRALRESVALARANGAKVAFVYMPEASEFRSWMPPEVERMAQAHLAKLRRELDLPLIDARLWMEDGYLVDGFHLSRLGAAEFTRKFGPALAATFPHLGSGREP